MGRDYAARVRAARAYAAMEQQAFASELGVSLRTLSRMESGERPATHDERAVIADLCGVPHWFMEHGFHPPAKELPPAEVNRRLSDLEEAVTYLRGLATQRVMADAAQAARDTDATRAGSPPPDLPGPSEAEGRR